MHTIFLSDSKVVKGCQSIHRYRVDRPKTPFNIYYSSFDREFSCSAQTANPICAQSFDLQPLQNGIPSTMPTCISFCKILSRNDTTLLLMPDLNCFIVIGIVAEFFLFSPSQRVKALIPSSTVLFLTMVASTLSEAFRLVPKISEEPDPFDSSSRRLLNMKSDYSILCLYRDIQDN